MSASSVPPAAPTAALRPRLWADLAELTKARLNALVVVTAAFGFLLGSGFPPPGWLLFHTLFGCALCALASGALNQLLESQLDARMERTAARPIPGGRMSPPAALAVGFLLGSWGIVHLATQVRPERPDAAWLGAATIAIYLFLYTPMKRTTPLNTLVGAVAGALPPVLGWVGAGQGYGHGAWFLFALQFAWQMPHFMAINWICREDYERAGFAMWAHGDTSGRRSAWISLAFAVLLLPICLWPALAGLCAWWAAAVAVALSAALTWLCIAWLRQPGRAAARRAFLASLLYLPLIYAVFLGGWGNS